MPVVSGFRLLWFSFRNDSNTFMDRLLVSIRSAPWSISWFKWNPFIVQTLKERDELLMDSQFSVCSIINREEICHCRLDTDIEARFLSLTPSTFTICIHFVNHTIYTIWYEFQWHHWKLTIYFVWLHEMYIYWGKKNQFSYYCDETHLHFQFSAFATLFSIKKTFTIEK